MQYPPSLTGQVLSWRKGPGGAAWSAVTTQLGGVTQFGGTGLYPQLQQECAGLASSVLAARSAPPIPDKLMQRSYANILAELTVTSADCRAAITVGQPSDEEVRVTANQALLKRSLAQFAAENTALYTATAEIRTLRA